jgi:hypothetical protein
MGNVTVFGLDGNAPVSQNCKFCAGIVDRTLGEACGLWLGIEALQTGAGSSHLHVIVGRWGVTMAEEEFEKALLEDGSNHLQTTLVASRNDLVAWLPALAEKTEEAKAVLR